MWSVCLYLWHLNRQCVCTRYHGTSWTVYSRAVFVFPFLILVRLYLRHSHFHIDGVYVCHSFWIVSFCQDNEEKG